MRFVSFASLSLCAGCTLVNSLDGVVGPPVDTPEDAGDADAPASDGGHVGDAARDSREGSAPDAGPAPDGNGDSATIDDGGPPGPRAIYTGVISPLGIALNATDVCWVGGDTPRGVFCAPKSGGGASAIRSLDVSDDTFLVNAFDIAIDDTYVYWSNGSNNQVVKRPLSGSGGSDQYFTGDGRLSYIVLRGTQLFASDYNASTPGQGSIVVGPSGGTSSMLIFPGETGAAGVGVLNETVYWGTKAGLAFGRQTGNVGVTRVATEAPVTGLAVDTQGIVYLLVGSQKIFRVVVGSTKPELLYDAGSAFGTSDLAVDDTTIYWSEHDNGAIMRMPKP